MGDRVTGDDQRDAAVLRIGAAVFGDLALAAGVGDADLGEADQVRDPRVPCLRVGVRTRRKIT